MVKETQSYELVDVYECDWELFEENIMNEFDFALPPFGLMETQDGCWLVYIEVMIFLFNVSKTSKFDCSQLKLVGLVVTLTTFVVGALKW